MYDSRYNKKISAIYNGTLILCLSLCRAVSCSTAASWGSSQPSIFIAGSSVFRLEASWNFRRLPYRCFIFFGRLGCFTAGCCYGIGGFPVQLVEAAINLMIFAVIILVQNQDKLRGKTFLPLSFVVYIC